MIGKRYEYMHTVEGLESLNQLGAKGWLIVPTPPGKYGHYLVREIPPDDTDMTNEEFVERLEAGRPVRITNEKPSSYPVVEP